MPDHRAFSRRFREIIQGENQSEVAGRLGYTQSRISQIARGEKPSRAFVEKLIEIYGLEREEWLELAGFIEREREDDETLMRRTAEEAARLAVREALAHLDREREPNPGEYYRRQIGDYHIRYGGQGYALPPAQPFFSHGGHFDSLESANRALASWLHRLQELNPGKEVSDLAEVAGRLPGE